MKSKLDIAKLASQFHQNSVIFVESLFDKKLCEQARNWFLEHEHEVIEKFSHDKRGLSCDVVNGSRLVKYFEYPLYSAPHIYGKFVNSEVMALAENLLQDTVCLVSCEIHSRSAGGTEIPPHQDNAYYGLEKGSALTFYIALDLQSPEDGGLQYLPNPSTNNFEHCPSSSKAFSLKILERLDHLKGENLSFTYKPGDCSVHHSRSIHFADPVPLSAQRASVFRMTFYSLSDNQKDGHKEWYQAMINSNRSADQATA